MNRCPIKKIKTTEIDRKFCVVAFSLLSCFLGYHPLFPGSWNIRGNNSILLIVFNQRSIRDSTDENKPIDSLMVKGKNLNYE